MNVACIWRYFAKAVGYLSDSQELLVVKNVRKLLDNRHVIRPFDSYAGLANIGLRIPLHAVKKPTFDELLQDLKQL